MKIMGKSQKSTNFRLGHGEKMSQNLLVPFTRPGNPSIELGIFSQFKHEKLEFHLGNVACRSNHSDFSPVLSWGFHQVGHSFAYRNSWWLGKRWNELNWIEMKWNELKWNEMNWMKEWLNDWMTWIELNEIELSRQSRAPKCSDSDIEVAPPVAPAVQTVTDNPKDSPLAPQESPG